MTLRPRQIDHSFGGYHTDLKLSAVEGYLKAFAKALANKFELWYIDAFAGTGYRTVMHAARPRDLFGNEAQPESKELRRGSAQIAVTVKPEFDFLVFIEKRPDFAGELEELRAKHPRRAIQVINGEANAAILRLLRTNTWRSKRAVLFLDPYGTQVEWSTLEAVAATKAIDVWYLFPLAGFYRQLPKQHWRLDEPKRKALMRLFGSDSWEDDFYPSFQMRNLSGEMTTVRRRRGRIKDYESYTKGRLSSIFGAVLDPLRLPREKGPTRYLLFLCISSRDTRAIEVATRIGSHILKSPGMSS